MKDNNLDAMVLFRKMQQKSKNQSKIEKKEQI